MKITWLTDIHLNFLSKAGVDSFIEQVVKTACDAILVTGDIGEAHDFSGYLGALAVCTSRPVYFVLGNHDFYRGSISGVRIAAEQITRQVSGLTYLSRESVVPLTTNTCLVGHDGWGDGRHGHYAQSTVSLSDWSLISDFVGLGKKVRLEVLKRLGDEAAEHFIPVLPLALENYEHILVATHVPPFKEACWHEGRISDDAWLPHFSCKAVGAVLIEAMRANPSKEMTVLCGHTHSSGEVQILPNLRVVTGGAIYGRPEIQRVISL